MEVVMKIIAFWDVTPYSLVEYYQRYACIFMGKRTSWNTRTEKIKIEEMSSTLIVGGKRFLLLDNVPLDRVAWHTMNDPDVIGSRTRTCWCLKNTVFWDVSPCRSCVNRPFVVTYRLHLQGIKIREGWTSVSRWLHNARLPTAGTHNINTAPHPRRRHSS
jgi:hypothetical protein